MNHWGLLLVDVQGDYLQHPSLQPTAAELIRALSQLLQNCRQAGVPILHSQTQIGPGSQNPMPHRQKEAHPLCVLGTPGCAPQSELAPRSGETVLSKPFFSAFSQTDLQPVLQRAQIQNLIVAGVYTHACVQATVLDAYQRGYQVWVPRDGVASNQSLHAQLSLDWLSSRACHLVSVSELCQLLKPKVPPASIQTRQAKTFALGFWEGQWQTGDREQLWPQHNPSDWEQMLGYVPLGSPSEVQAACRAAARAQPTWEATSLHERLQLLATWAQTLRRHEAEWLELLALEVGKPLQDAVGEFRYGLNLLQHTLDQCRREAKEPGHTPQGTEIRYRARGTLGLITPWNNPFALLIGKIAPALAYGNSAVWKPALPAPRLSALLVQSLHEAGLPSDLLTLIHGDACTAQALVLQPEISALSLTGSTAAGQELAWRCALHGKALQAELGGNNAVLISASADLKTLAQSLAPAVYSFNSQRCTAPRRLIIHQRCAEDFIAAFVEASQTLCLGQPRDPETALGPLISRSQQTRMAQIVAESQSHEGKLLQGGHVPKGFEAGCWYAPTLLEEQDPGARSVQEESFGPVAVLLRVPDFTTALHYCNAVPQGLFASLYSQDPEETEAFLQHAQAGMLRLNALQGQFDVAAPFGGWKTSGWGPPEHGRWDREFYTRPQAIYR